MRLLKCGQDGEFTVTKDLVNGCIPPYAILSHTWGPDSEEVTFKDLVEGTGRDKAGYDKITFCAEQARRDSLRYFWVDTCCIDKSNNTELSEAINSMFRWYHNADRCYVYLSNISIAGHEQDSENSEPLWESSFRASRWFTRGWTLQELLAPVSVEFFTREGRRLGNKRSLERQIHEISGIPIRALQGTPLSEFGTEERFKWAETRWTTRDEDWAYCLLGIFGVFMPLIYGEGRENAVRRLKKEINEAPNYKYTSNCKETYDGPQVPHPPVIVATIGPHADEQNERHWIVPFDRNKDFIGREAILAKLLEMIPPSADKDACQQTAIEGLGGVGKTQIALEAAFRVREKHQDCSVFWIPAIDAATFESAYRDIGRRLKVQGVEEDKADVKLLIKTALSRSARNWLLIIDNADDVDLLLGSVGASPLFDYLPSSYNGSVLFTTRNDAVVRGLDIPRSNVARITEMSRPEAEELLQRNVDPAQLRDPGSTTQLLDILADLPLAIRQASAYIAKTGMTVTKYLGHCHSSDERLVELLSKDFADRGRYKTAQNAIATTWLISFHHISRDNPLAAQYLKFMSFLAERAIPKSLLPPGDELEAEEAIGTLLSYAFISKRSDQDSYDMHQLVQLAMRNWLAARELLLAHITIVIQRFDEAFPFPNHMNRIIWGTYLPHAQKALAFRDKSTDMLAVSRLLFNVAESNLTLGKYTEAETMFRETLAVQTKALGAEHPDTLKSRSSLATTLRSQGKYAEAEAVYRETLMLQMKALGAEHPNTLKTRNGLANALSSQGMYAQAEAMYRDTLVVQTKELGAEHLDTLRTKNNLANALYSRGWFAEAETIYSETLMLQTKVLGIDHPDTLTSKNNLALTLGSQGHHAEAEKIHRETLLVRTKVLGTEHPDVLKSRSSLATTLRSQGKYAEAEVVYRETLVLQTKALGAEHPDTLGSRDSLANMLLYWGRDSEAEAIYLETLELETVVLGAEYFNKSVKGIENIFKRRLWYVEVETMYQELLVLQMKELGAEHPDTLEYRDCLASAHLRLKKYAEAEAIYREMLVIQTKALGVGHPDTVKSIKGLEDVLRNQQKDAEVETMYQEVLVLQTKALGAEHPDTLKSRNSLTSALCRQRKYAEAEAMYRETLVLQTKALGAEHFDMHETRNSLASTLYRQEKYAEAEAMYRETLVHFDTHESRRGLRSVLRRQGNYDEAEVIYPGHLLGYVGAARPRSPLGSLQSSSSTS